MLNVINSYTCLLSLLHGHLVIYIKMLVLLRFLFYSQVIILFPSNCYDKWVAGFGFDLSSKLIVLLWWTNTLCYYEFSHIALTKTESPGFLWYSLWWSQANSDGFWSTSSKICCDVLMDNTPWTGCFLSNLDCCNILSPYLEHFKTAMDGNYSTSVVMKVTFSVLLYPTFHSRTRIPFHV